MVFLTEGNKNPIRLETLIVEVPALAIDIEIVTLRHQGREQSFAGFFTVNHLHSLPKLTFTGLPF